MSGTVTAEPLRVTAVRTPMVYGGSFADAHALACEQLEPVFVPIAPYADDRGWSYMNLMVGVLGEAGQINFSTQYPGAIKAWHRHDRQTDFWCCIGGHLKAGAVRRDGAAWVQVFGDRRPGVLVIPPPLWHGATVVGAVPAGLLYYVTHAYDAAAPDEHRRAWDSISGFPWDVRHG